MSDPFFWLHGLPVIRQEVQGARTANAVPWPLWPLALDALKAIDSPQQLRIGLSAELHDARDAFREAAERERDQ